MYEDFVHHWELAKLIYEQSKLTSKATALTTEEKQLSRERDTRIDQLLQGFISWSVTRQEKWHTPTVRWIYLN